MNNSEWSTYLQNPDFLESSRLMIMNSELTGYVAGKLALKPGMRVLDVGCGTGAFGYYLSGATENIEFSGIDTDSEYIEAARGKAAEDDRGNRFLFFEGDAAKLPFPDASFDAVVSHTFLTAAACYEAAFREMQRVCKPDGLIGTINIADFSKTVHHSAASQDEKDKRFDFLLEKFQRACERLYPLSRASEGISPNRIPAFFTNSGLTDVCVSPIGSFFSLSNSIQNLPKETKGLYLNGMRSSLEKRISAYAAVPGFDRIMPESELEELRKLASERYSTLLSENFDNRDWNYDGYLYLLVTGRNSYDNDKEESLKALFPSSDTGKYKDAHPEETLRRIQSVLSGLGIQTEERFTGSGMEGLYSCRVTVKCTDIGQNGKGTTPEYALASGYAEFMERLGTGFLVPFDAPDREILPIKNCIEEGGELLRTALSRVYDIPLFLTDTDHILQQWRVAEEVTDAGSGFPGYRFTRFTDNKSFFLPEFLYRGFAYTNGSCAGNTREEAMVQGLCEITERYAALKILGNRLSPPVIPEDELKKHPDVYRLVNTIKQETGFQLFVFDASLGLGLPVVCTLLLDPEEKKACVRFGSHPIFEVALERALTELLQGRHTGRISGMCAIGAEYEKDISLPENLFNLLKIGLGTVSLKLLDGISKKPSWDFHPWEAISGGNSAFLEQMLSLCDNLGWDVYYRDCSFFSFPVFHLFVPQCSMIMSHGKADIARVLMRTSHLKSLRNFPEADETGKQKALLTAKLYSGMALHEDLDQLAGVSFHAQIDNIKIDYTLLSALYDIERKDFGQAAEKLKNHSALNETLWCLRQLCLAEDGPVDISSLLASAVKDPSALEAARSIFSAPYSVLPRCTFPACGDCERREICDSYRIRKDAGLK
ncbi:MAG: YcaO-like family protein [Eubacteriales bacterium]|nr:YcaO-like family protein [Eubacteriales bacterium]